MAKLTDTERRYKVLRTFLTAKEAEFFARYEYNSIPYIKELLANRQRVTTQSRRKHLSEREHGAKVYDWYNSKGWVKPIGKKVTTYVPDFWAAWHAAQLQYESRTGVKDDEYHKQKKQREKSFAELERNLKKKLGPLGY